MGLLAKAFNNIADVSLRATKSGSWHPANWPRDGSLERWLITGDSKPGTYTGKHVDEESALSNTAVWSAVMQLAQGVASLPLHLYKRLDRGKERAINNPLYRLLHLKPNPEMTSMDWREAQMGQVLRYGTCYSEKEFDTQGDIKALWPLLSRDVKPDRIAGQLVYVVTVPSAKDKVLDASRVLKVGGFSANGLIGYSPINQGKQAIALGLAVEEYGARFFGNGAMPSGVLEHPEAIGIEAQDRLRKSWNKIHEGLKKSHRIAILEEGMKYNKIGSDPQEAQALETRKFSIEEVARIFNMPVHMLKNLDRATNNNIEFQGMEFVIYTLRAWLVKFEQCYTTQLLSDKEQKKYFFEHLVDGLLRGDTEKRHQSYRTGRQWGYYSANDVREMENKNSIGEEGDVYLVPMNMIPADKAEELADSQIEGNENKGEGTDIIEGENTGKDEKSLEIAEKRSANIAKVRTRIADSFKHVFSAGAQKIVNKENIAIKRALKKYLDVRGMPDFQSWMSEFYSDLDPYVQNIMGPIIRSYAEQVYFQVSEEIMIENPTLTIELDEFINDYLDQYSRRHINRSISWLNDAITPDEDEDLLVKTLTTLDRWRDDRADQIAEEETNRLANAVAMFTLFVGGYAATWRTTGDNICPFCVKLNGMKIRFGQFFVKDGDAITPAKGEGDPMKVRGTKKHPPLHMGCKCILVAG